MKKICLEHLETGMTLARNVVGPNGEVALPAGQQLDDAAFDVLDTLGVGSVMVEDKDAMADESVIMKRVEAYVLKFFQYVDPDCEAFIELFRLCMERTWDATMKGWDLPCESEFKAQNVEHMRDLFFKGKAGVDELVKHETSLGSFPDIYVRIKQVLDSPTSSAEDIAKVVSADPGMTSKLLKLVNSPVFGLASKIDSIPHAVSLIGIKELATLALGISTINYFKDIPPELINMKAFWGHSISCAVFAKLIANRVGEPSDRFFTAGLLHDSGRLIMYKNMPYASVQSLIYARHNTVPLVEAEKEVLDFTHQDVAQRLLQQWDFPPDLLQVIVNHHSPEKSPDAKGAAIVQLADNMANGAAISNNNMFVLPGMADSAWKTLGLQPEDLKRIIERHDEDIDNISNAFF